MALQTDDSKKHSKRKQISLGSSLHTSKGELGSNKDAEGNVNVAAGQDRFMEEVKGRAREQLLSTDRQGRVGERRRLQNYYSVNSQ